MCSSTAGFSNRIVWNDRERVGDWAIARIPHVTNWGERYQAIGLERDGELCAAVVFNLYSGADIAMHVAAVPGRRWLNREYMRACLGYPFLQLQVRRISGFVPARNAEARKFDEHLGFKVEGVMRNALPDDDVIVYGMLREECRFL